MRRTALWIPGILICGLFLAGCKEKVRAKPDYPAQPVSFASVDINDEFWAPRQEVNRTVSIWHCFDKFKETADFESPKLFEAAAYMLAKKPDPKLRAYVEQDIDKLVASLEKRLADPDQAVHLSGHFMEAAAAYYEATGNRKMLEAASKIVDRIDSAYGPGKKSYISGHEGQKIGLIRLYRLTRDEKYFRLAKFFLDERGREGVPREGEYARDRTYAQDHKPVVEQDEAVGHAVRAMFLYIALTDIAALTGDPAYTGALDKIWEDMVTKKTYVTGGIGSIRFHEQFGAPYELPNLSAWNETCASYGSVVWNHRLFLLYRDAKYLDLMERVLYNGLLVGVSLKGDRFFYQNPLKSFGNYERFDWINVPCCPPNVVRLLASLGSYIYATTADGIYVNLFVGSQARINQAGIPVALRQETRYPWDGRVTISVEPERPGRFDIYVRIPGWTRNQPLAGDLYYYVEDIAEKVGLKVNGRPVETALEKGFARLSRTWNKGDVIELDLPMPVRKVMPNWQIRDDEGRVALERGPLVYCAEWPDNGGHALNLFVPDDSAFKSEFRSDLLGGVSVITGNVMALERGKDRVSIGTKRHELAAIPYFAWANRGLGEMEVWLARRGNKSRATPVPPDPVGRVTSFGGIVKTWTGYNDQSDDLSAVYDGVDPLSSADESSLYYRLRPPQGKPAWIEYEFKSEAEVSSAEVYWVDDRRFCRPPASWRILYKDDQIWKPVAARQAYGAKKDEFNRVTFDSVRARALRLEIEPQKIPYKAGQIGPPEALFLEKDIEWRECGVIEWRIK